MQAPLAAARLIELRGGWPPRGLVYGLLATASMSGGSGRGAAAMLAFGLGTLPNLLLAGMLFKCLPDIVSDRRLRFAAGGRCCRPRQSSQFG
ncbi:MAG: sulfite exporter TauE/SafE family protein [Pseudomonadota bacterium]